MMRALIGTTSRRGWSRFAGRPAWRLAVSLGVAGALAAGCGSATVSAPAASARASGAASSGHVAGGTDGNGAAVHSTGTAVPLPPGTPPGTVAPGTVAPGTVAPGTVAPTAANGGAVMVAPTAANGGAVTVDGTDCAGWPTGLARAPLPGSFVPVSVERCVDSATAIPGKGWWTTATLERSSSGLAGLVDALRQPSATARPGTVCPALAVIPPQLMLVNAAGQRLLPVLPVSACGLPAARVLTELAALRWQRVSVRMIAPVPSAPASAAAASDGHVHPG